MNKELCCILNPYMGCDACESRWCEPCSGTKEYIAHWGSIRGKHMCIHTGEFLKWDGKHSIPIVWCPI